MPDLFGGNDAPKKKPRGANLTHPFRDYFAVFEKLCGASTVKAANTRCAKLASEMQKAGLTAARLADELPVVAARYARFQKVWTLNLVALAWRWILSPPAAVDRVPASIELAAKVIEINGGKPPF